MVTIRLTRGGAKKKPFYHVVATDSRARRDGRYIERLGFYSPVAGGDAQTVQLNLERLDYWVGVGAQMSDRVRKIVKSYRQEQAQENAAA
ncbi:MAG: 30S ribosomal protein S16 [Gammaproteobacteria bacterium]|nr:MAG: 30S ribosomal protein S16 [Gammaproteobacteria bacterium]